jgi:hypothetical protein
MAVLQFSIGVNALEKRVLPGQYSLLDTMYLYDIRTDRYPRQLGQ